MQQLRKSRLAVFLLAATFLVAMAVFSGCDSGPEVPDVVGMGQADAVRALQEAGFQLGDINFVYSSNVPKGTVASTNPPAGTKADEGTKVDISIDMGIGSDIVVPAVTGIPKADAEKRLTGINLVPVAVESYSETVTPGVVMAQVPAPTSTVSAGSTVIIQVSKGKAAATVVVPNVVGKSKDGAESAIEGLGLNAEAYEAYSNSVAKGTVIAQSPAAGTAVAAGADIAVLVSLGKGVGAVAMPNVVGKSEADAVAAVNAVGLKPRVYRQNSDTVAAGTVSAQLPAAGSTTASGSEVGIVVSLGKATGTGNVTVPGVVGQAEADAKAALEAVGFVVQVVPQAGTAPEGTVSAQVPVANSTAPAGSPVAIVVSTGS